jgi:hypothetical protein
VNKLQAVLRTFGEFGDEDFWIDDLRSSCMVKVIFAVFNSLTLSHFLVRLRGDSDEGARGDAQHQVAGRPRSTDDQRRLHNGRASKYLGLHVFTSRTVHKDLSCFVVNLQAG